MFPLIALAAVVAFFAFRSKPPPSPSTRPTPPRTPPLPEPPSVTPDEPPLDTNHRTKPQPGPPMDAAALGAAAADEIAKWMAKLD